jgi:hypothetical protein
MPGHNHFPYCRCGWCFKRSSGNRNIVYNLSNFSGNPLTENRFTDKLQESKTCLTSCWWCGDTVFYHTNGNGDSVLFDSLGSPWEVHSCWSDYSNGLKRKNGVLFNRSTNGFMPEPSIYFNNKAENNNENLISLKEKQHEIFLGSVQQIDNKKINKFSIFGFQEEKISSFMNLSTEDFREIYGGFYIKYDSGIISIITLEFSKNFEKIKFHNFYQKRHLIFSNIKDFTEIKIARHGEKYVFYNLNEEMLAQSFGLSIKELRLHFEKVYVYSSGKIEILHNQLKASRTPDATKSMKINENAKVIKKNEDASKNKNSIINTRRNKKTSHSKPKHISSLSNLCPYCKFYSSNNKIKLIQHINRQHHITILNDS